jgi:hypothetical protein
MPISIPTSVAGISIPGAINGPLSMLYGNKYLKNSYAFPRDLGSNPARNHVIWFDVMIPEPGNQNAIVPEGGISAMGETAVQTGKDAVALTATTAASILSGNYTPTVDAAKSAAQNLMSSKGTAAFASTVNNLTQLKLKRRVSASIALYVPDTVNVTYESNYNETSITGALGAPYKLAQGAVSLFNTFSNGGSSAESMINSAANDPFVREYAAGLIGKATGTDLKDLALNSGGYAMNPQLQVLFQGIDFRRFQFDFVLTPHTKEEAATIKKIIEEFKMAAAPRFMENKVFTTSVFLEIPDTFKIKFMYNGAENPNVHKIEECVLENINIDYAPNGWSTFNDGAPVQTRMTLQFRETVIIDKNKIKSGY